MGKENLFVLMDLLLRDNFLKVKFMEEQKFNFLMETHMMDNGNLTKPTDLEFITIIQGLFTKVIGLRTYKME